MKTLLIQLKGLVLVVFTMSAITLNAQSPDHQYQFEGNVKLMMLTESGVLVASTGEALVGIKPNQNDLHFKFTRVKKVKEEHLEPVPNTPYLIIKPRGLFNHTVVIDVVKGAIVFDSKAENWQNGVTSRYFIYPDMKLVVNGMHKEGTGKYTQGVGLYDMTSGKLIQVFKRKASNLMVGVPDIDGDHIIIPGTKNVIAYNISTAQEVWKAEVKNATRISSNDDANEIYAFRTKGGNTVAYKIDAKSGQLLWQDGNKLKGNLARYEFTKGGLAVVTNVDNTGKKGLGKLASSKSQSKIYLLDSDSGKDRWEKSPKTKGFVSHFYVEEDGILFGVASGGINKISFDGNPLWEKPLKTGANIQLMARVPKGVLYISESDADVIDMNSGESVFGKIIKYKKSKSVASTFDKERNRFLIACSDGVYEIDGANGSYNLLASKNSFEGKEEPTAIEIREEGILLSASQNLEMLGFNGDKKWHTYRRAPGTSALGVVFFAAITAASLTATAAHSYAKGSSSVALGPYSSTTTYHSQQADNWSDLGNASFNEMAKRFKASKATENAAFILTKVDGGVGLVKVDKDSGKVLKEILVKDKKPMYEVDEFEGVLYFKAKSNSIYAHNLKD